jgi:hypothetical protein
VLTGDEESSDGTLSQVNIVPERFDVELRTPVEPVVAGEAPSDRPQPEPRRVAAADAAAPASLASLPDTPAAVAVATSATTPAGDAGERAPVPAGSDGAKTASGYKRRVRGANTPRTDVTSAGRLSGGERGGRSETEPRDGDAAENDTSTADGVRNLLSGLQAGTERGRAEAHQAVDTLDAADTADTAEDDDR